MQIHIKWVQKVISEDYSPECGFKKNVKGVEACDIKSLFKATFRGVMFRNNFLYSFNVYSHEHRSYFKSSIQTN